MTKRFGFTLAEVLITLAIIGVVAALTMPTLVNSTSAAQFKTSFKKAMSVLSQAVVMNIALDDYDFEGTTTTGTDDGDLSLYNLFNDRANLTEITNDSWEINLVNYDNTTIGDNGDNYTFRFNDGIVFSFPNGAYGCSETNPCYGIIDVNGSKGPNTLTTCDDDGDGNCDLESGEEVDIKDVYAFKFYGQQVLPSNPAARAVMFGAEKKRS